MSAHRPTIADVASAAHVSVAAVSQAINGRGRISHTTRQHILAVADSLGYRPNPIASALRRGESHRVGLISRFGSDRPSRPADNAFYLDIALPLADALLSEGFSLELVPAGHGERGHHPELGVAIVIDPLSDDPLVKDLRRDGARVVTIGRAEGVVADAVVDRGASGADVIVEALRPSSRIRALLASIPLASSVAVRQYLESIEGIEIESIALDSTDDEIRETIGRLYAADPGGTALYAPFDGHAAAAIRALDQLAIPDDAVVVATHYSRQPETHTSRPLVTLDLHLDVVARQCAELAIALLTGNAPSSIMAPPPSIQWSRSVG